MPTLLPPFGRKHRCAIQSQLHVGLVCSLMIQRTVSYESKSPVSHTPDTQWQSKNGITYWMLFQKWKERETQGDH